MLPTIPSICRRAALWAALILSSYCHAAASESDRWVTVRAREFTVITTLREKEAVAWAGEFSQFVAALQGYLNVDPRRLPRLTLVVFARERDFARFRPKRENGTSMDVGGFFGRRDSWAVAGLPATGMNEEARRTLFHEGTHWFLSAIELPNPVWLEEGLAEVFSTFAIEQKRVVFGRAIALHVQTLRTVPASPLPELLFLPRDSLHGEDEHGALRAERSYAQAWAFVHYLVFGQRDVPTQSLIDYVRRLRSSHPDEAFQAAFGGTYAEVGRKFQAYLQNGRYYVAKQPPVEMPDLEAEPANAVEVHDSLARLRIAGNRHAEARENLRALIAAAPDDPRGYELQGELEKEAGDEASARAAFHQAVARGSQDFRPYYELALAAHAEAANKGGSSEMSPELARNIANGYERAINLNPRFRPAYQAVAGVMERVPSGNKEDARFLEFGLILYPDDAMMRLGLAAIAKREGDAVRARSILDQVLGSTTIDTPARIYARMLDNAWTNQDLFAELNALAEQKKFSEALSVLDQKLDDGVNFDTRQRLLMTREQLHAALLTQEAWTALGERDWETAREKLNAVLASNASPLLKAQVRRQLEELNRARKAKMTAQ